MGLRGEAARVGCDREILWKGEQLGALDPCSCSFAREVPRRPGRSGGQPSVLSCVSQLCESRGGRGLWPQRTELSLGPPRRDQFLLSVRTAQG